jgi:hypothetical protein
MEGIEYLQALIIPVIVFVEEVFKKIGLPSKYIPVINVALGLFTGIVFNLDDIVKGITIGIVLGLSAGGFYDLIKKPQLLKK